MVDFQMYDLAVSKTATNLMSYAKRHDNKIELKNFDPTNHTHMYIFEVARLVSNINNSEKIILGMGFWKHLFSSKDIRHTKRARSFSEGIDIEKFLDFTFTEIDATPDEIWEEYYK